MQLDFFINNSYTVITGDNSILLQLKPNYQNRHCEEGQSHDEAI